jgi:hypothetical protein
MVVIDILPTGYSGLRGEKMMEMIINLDNGQ